MLYNISVYYGIVLFSSFKHLYFVVFLMNIQYDIYNFIVLPLKNPSVQTVSFRPHQASQEEASWSVHWEVGGGR